MAYEDNDDIDTNMSEFGDISDTHGHNYNTKGGNAYVGLGSPPKRGVSLKQRMVFREKKRVSVCVCLLKLYLYSG